MGTTILIFAYKVKEIPTPQPSPETGSKEIVHPSTSHTQPAVIKEIPSTSITEEDKPLETTSQTAELPEAVPNTPQEGTHLPVTGEETSHLSLLGLGILAGLTSLVAFKKKHD